MSAKTKFKRLVISSLKLLSTATIASPFLLQVEPASANCRVFSTVLEVAKPTNQECLVIHDETRVR